MGSLFDPSLIIKFLPKLIPYLPISILILVGSMLMGTIVAFVLFVFRIYKVPVLNQLSIVYISFIRGTPIIVQLFLIFYGVPAFLQGIHIDVSRAPAIIFVCITYGLGIGAYLEEIIRGAVNSVENGQTEAAYSVGMTKSRALIRIVMPQALIVAFPNLANLMISYLKETSLAFMIGVIDMMGMASVLGNQYYHYLETYVDLAIIYYVICLFLNKFFRYVEKILKKHEKELVRG